jgi:VIT1/CCC1 family predicted Fe2+/Mn2+ transporter
MTTVSQEYWFNYVSKVGEGLHVIERIDEVIYGLIAALTFTCSISIANSGKEEVQSILWTAVGCNFAWGMIDAVIIIFSTLLYRGEAIKTLNEIRNAATDEEASKVIKSTMPPLAGTLLKREHFKHLRDEILKLPPPPESVFLTWTDVKNALLAFILVFTSTIPVILPFLFITQPHHAVRVSNWIALILLFITGRYFGKKTGFKPWRTAFILTIIGVAIVIATIYLGG